VEGVEEEEGPKKKKQKKRSEPHKKWWRQIKTFGGRNFASKDKSKLKAQRTKI
jgi:hypothetical protein